LLTIPQAKDGSDLRLLPVVGVLVEVLLLRLLLLRLQPRCLLSTLQDSRCSIAF
jgi:hypothetical protein